MKSFKIIPKLPPVDINRIQEDEKKMKVNLPQSYKNFLLESNGGKPNNNFEYYDEEDDFYTYMIFLGIAGDDVKLSEEDLYYNYIRTKDIYPKNFVPIARTGGTPTVCIDTNPESFGQIFTFTTDVPPDEFTHRYGMAWKIEDSFEEFINNFKEKPIPEDEIVEEQLREAVKQKDIDTIKNLLTENRNSKYFEEYLDTVFTFSIHTNTSTVLIFCVENYSINLNKYLLDVAQKGVIELLDFFRERGANIDYKWIKGGAGLVIANDTTPLMVAAECEKIEMVKYLIELGADVNARSEEGSVLWYAQETGNEEIIQLLKEAGAKE